jgi:hypothetical protein
MAKYTVTRACGHTETVALFGKGKDRDWRLENVEPQKLCYECWQAELARQREEEYQKAVQEAQESGLPGLTGTEKQIAWAERIRISILEKVEGLLDKMLKSENPNLENIELARRAIQAKTSASWWIDHRDSHPYRILQEVAEEIADAKQQPPRAVVQEAKTEATVRPETTVTETVAEIKPLDSAVEISFPERRDDFRELVKGLGYKWESNCWQRKLSTKNGTPQDRAAEAGHRLLAAGFLIRIYDEAIRAKAISGDYEPEYTRWVQLRTGEKYTGWLAINWERPDDFYKAAKRIAGARWSKPSVVVPPENFEEVLDFAQMYGFKVSQAAQDAIEAARIVRENTLTVSVNQPAKQGSVIVSGVPPVLEVPQEVEIDAELCDND